MWYCCDLQNEITTEHIKIFGAVSARCSKSLGVTEVDIQADMPYHFFKKTKWIAYLAFVTHSCIQEIIQR